MDPTTLLPAAGPDLQTARHFVEWGYAVYLALSIVMTVLVGWTLYRNGRVFLVDAFHGNAPIADSVNHLLVVGFYLVNIGLVALALKYGDKPATLQSAMEFVSTKVGLVLMVLGAMHFGNLFLFSRLRHLALHPKAAPTPGYAQRPVRDPLA
jgi:hypothetical protein